MPACPGAYPNARPGADCLQRPLVLRIVRAILRPSPETARILLVIQFLRNTATVSALDYRDFSHSIALCGEGCHHSAKAARGENLQVEEPVACRYTPAFHFHTILASVLGPTLIRDEVVQVREPREKRLLTATRMVKPFHRE